MTEIINENGDIATNSTEINNIKKEYQEQLYKLDNLDEMDKFLET